MRRRELADDYASREAAGIMTCGETYFMALRAARWDRQTNKEFAKLGLFSYKTVEPKTNM